MEFSTLADMHSTFKTMTYEQLNSGKELFYPFSDFFQYKHTYDFFFLYVIAIGKIQMKYPHHRNCICLFTKCVDNDIHTKLSKRTQITHIKYPIVSLIPYNVNFISKQFKVFTIHYKEFIRVEFATCHVC